MAKEIKKKKSAAVKRIMAEVEELDKKDKAAQNIKDKHSKLNRQRRDRAKSKTLGGKLAWEGHRLCVFMNRHVHAEMVEKANACGVSMSGAFTAGCKLWLEQSTSKRQALAMACMKRQKLGRKCKQPS